MNAESKKRAEQLRKEMKESQEILSRTNDPDEKKVIDQGIKMIKKEIEELESESVKTQPEEKKKIKVKSSPVKKKQSISRKKIKKAVKEVKEKKKPEKTVKISKVVPTDEKKKVRELLENEHFKVIIKDVGGKKVKVTVKHSDKTVAKNKIESAFVTITKDVSNNDEDKKKYSDDLKVVYDLESSMKKLIEIIYAAFNSHKTDELKKILDLFSNL
jgi:hypothetical protein